MHVVHRLRNIIGAGKIGKTCGCGSTIYDDWAHILRARLSPFAFSFPEIGCEVPILDGANRFFVPKSGGVIYLMSYVVNRKLKRQVVSGNLPIKHRQLIGNTVINYLTLQHEVVYLKVHVVWCVLKGGVWLVENVHVPLFTICAVTCM